MAAIFPPVAFMVVGACTSPLQTAPQIGDCVPDAATKCTFSNPSSSIVLTPEAGAPEDSGEIISESLDGASCGTVDTLVVADCSSCIIQFCCMSDSECSLDSGCLSLVVCAAANTPCPSISQASTANFNGLLQCLNTSCQSQCLTVADHDF
jgi:hypothetical protein